MESIAILYICTGNYVIFWEDFFNSFEENFLPHIKKEYYVFTDAKDLYMEKSCERIHKIYQQQLGWPKDTLMRYHIFEKVEESLKLFDYVFFMNSNLVCVEKIGREILPFEKDLVTVIHPGFYNQSKFKFPYERSKKSTAYIPFREGEVYVCGGVNGGKSHAYIQMIRCLRERTDEDLINEIIPIWHDESQINRYIIDRQDVQIMGPEYCHPEGWKLPVEPKIIVKEKSNYLDVKKIKGFKLTPFFLFQIRKIQGYLWELLVKNK